MPRRPPRLKRPDTLFPYPTLFRPLDAAHFAQNTDERHALDALEKRLNRSGLGKPRYSLELQAASDTQPGALLVTRRHMGEELVQVLPFSAFETGDQIGRAHV